jgi:hypothetical protein
MILYVMMGTPTVNGNTRNEQITVKIRCCIPPHSKLVSADK